MEQSEPSIKLPRIVNADNNRDFAEAFRFGNSAIDDNFRVKVGIPKVLEHLSKRVGVKNVTEDKLQIVRFYDKDKEVQTRICYFDPTTGRSLVYYPEGKYMYQMEYNKDGYGNIIACTKF